MPRKLFQNALRFSTICLFLATKLSAQPTKYKASDFRIITKQSSHHVTEYLDPNDVWKPIETLRPTNIPTQEVTQISIRRTEQTRTLRSLQLIRKGQWENILNFYLPEPILALLQAHFDQRSYEEQAIEFDPSLINDTHPQHILNAFGLDEAFLVRPDAFFMRENLLFQDEQVFIRANPGFLNENGESEDLLLLTHPLNQAQSENFQQNLDRASEREALVSVRPEAVISQFRNPVMIHEVLHFENQGLQESNEKDEKKGKEKAKEKKKKGSLSTVSSRGDLDSFVVIDHNETRTVQTAILAAPANTVTRTLSSSSSPSHASINRSWERINASYFTEIPRVESSSSSSSF